MYGRVTELIDLLRACHFFR